MCDVRGAHFVVGRNDSAKPTERTLPVDTNEQLADKSADYLDIALLYYILCYIIVLCKRFWICSYF